MKKDFSVAKILEVLSRFQRDTKSENLNKFTALKLMFFADRFHLRHYGSPLTGDSFYAMHLGPVASLTKSLINNEVAYLGSISERDIQLFDSSTKRIGEGSHRIWIDTRRGEYSDLSDSEIEALSFVTSTFGRFSERELIEITHDYPEWKKYEDFFSDENRKVRQPMFFSDFFLNPDVSNSPSIQKYLRTDPFFETESQMNIMREYYLETYPEDTSDNGI